MFFTSCRLSKSCRKTVKQGGATIKPSGSDNQNPTVADCAKDPPSQENDCFRVSVVMQLICSHTLQSWYLLSAVVEYLTSKAKNKRTRCRMFVSRLMIFRL